MAKSLKNCQNLTLITEPAFLPNTYYVKDGFKKLNIIKMEKTKEIHKALKRRKFVNAEINSMKEAIDRLTKLVSTFGNEKKLLNFELQIWDIFSNKTNS